MSHSYSPIARCEAEHTMVQVNKLQQDCALEHGCPPGRNCPVGNCFANIHATHRNAAAGELNRRGI